MTESERIAKQNKDAVQKIKSDSVRAAEQQKRVSRGEITAAEALKEQMIKKTKSISEIFTLFDDESVKEKITVMDKWEAMMDDARNSHDFGDRIEKFLKLGKKYRLTVTEVP